MINEIIVVPHTHWDREWFFSFEIFRFHLVEFMDDLISKLEEYSNIPSFLLDGQTILFEDYLEIRPEMRERLERLTRAGRISLGPWYVQPDEFHITGESLIRNLETGIQEASRWGKPMLQGYVPDTFGHITQLPQLFRGFGIKTFYFMRGFGEDIEKAGAEFLWKAPDGSKAATLFLSESYSSGGNIGPAPSETFLHHGSIVNYNNLDELIVRMEKKSNLHTLLLLNGSDHTTLQEGLAENIASLSRFHPVRLGSLEEMGDRLLEAENRLPIIEGELRFGRYYSVLKDTASSRIYLKQFNSRCEENILEAERFCAIAQAMGGGCGALLARAWKELLKNHAHDSICGCSADSVHREMLVRFTGVMDIAKTTKYQVLEELALGLVSTLEPPAKIGVAAIPLVVFNPSPWERSGYTRAKIIPLPGKPLGKRDFGYGSPKRAFDLRQLILFDDQGREIPFESDGGEITVRDITLRRKILQEDRILFYADSVPSMGYRIFWAVPQPASTKKRTDTSINTDNTSADNTEVKPILDNGLVRIGMHTDGTLTLTDYKAGFSLEGLNYFIDEGEAGDEYTQSPFPRPDFFSSTKMTWKIEKRENRIYGECDFILPQKAAADRKGRTGETLACKLSVRIELHPGESLVRVRVTFDNHCEDHRLRACFPTGIESDISIAETAFGLIPRPRRPEPCSDFWEKTTAANPQRRFVVLQDRDRGFVLFNQGLPEFEADPKGLLHLTLLRSVGWLSRGDLLTRTGQAGPEIPTPDAQCPGQHVFEYAIYLFSGAIEDQGIFRIAEEYLHPLNSITIQTQKTAGLRPMGKNFMSIDNKRIVLSCFRAEGESFILRVYNPFAGTETFVVRWALPLAKVRLISLGGSEIQKLKINADGYGFNGRAEAYAIINYRIVFKKPEVSQKRNGT